MRPLLIAHRGLPYRFPENSLEGFQAAIRVGATWCETDVQLTADGVPVLFHDDDTQRLCGRAGKVTDSTLADLQETGVFHPDRFGAQFRGNPLTTLRQLVQLLARYPNVRLFLELKCESERAFGTERFADTVLNTLAAFELRDRVVFISFSERVLRFVRDRTRRPTGLVTERWDRETQTLVAEFQPDYLFLNVRVVTPGSMARSEDHSWQGPWQTVVYTVNDEQTARQLASQGLSWLETDYFDVLGETMQ